MAKSENPAEASSPARLPRPGARLHPDPGLSPGAPAVAGRYDDVARHELRGHELRGNAADVRVGAGGLQGHLEGPGLAKARRAALHPDFADTTRSSVFPDQLDADLLADDDVLDEAAAHGAVRVDAFPGARFGLPRLGGAKVPLANLEPPSSARVELTPSPVPRVSLSPATGAVDISLVPGPNMAHSRNLPTLAAQHVLGRRQPRRPAPAVTLPPPGDVNLDPLRPSELALEVRSSKREVVLGLTIGLGLSMLLAVVGQAYLREDVVAEAQPTSAEVESITLSARPETDARGVALQASAAPSPSAASEARPAAGSSGAVSPEARGADPLGVASSGEADTQPEPTTIAASPSAPSTEDEPMLAHARPEVAKSRSGRVPSRAVRDSSRQSGARQSVPRAHRAPAIAVEPPAFEPEKSLSEAARDRSSMSPAESAGLGLDLPL